MHRSSQDVAGVGVVATTLLLCAACNNATRPGDKPLTGYAITLTPGTGCQPFSRPSQFTLAYCGVNSQQFHTFSSLRTAGTPRDPYLQLWMRNTSGGQFEGRFQYGAYGFWFSPPGPLISSGPVPFVGTGEVATANLTATLNAHVTLFTEACNATDHRLTFVRVVEKLDRTCTPFP